VRVLVGRVGALGFGQQVAVQDVGGKMRGLVG
jgi:hypothetical protein